MTGHSLAASKQLKHLLARLVQADAQIVKYTRCDTFAFTNQSKQDMLSTYIGVTQLASLIHGQFYNLLGSWSISDICRLLLATTD
ncbi:hypothetical protein D3C74_397150 [compost metagenome]